MNITKTTFILLMTALFTANAYAMNPIVRTFTSVRAEGMGNVRYTTGLYEENFYANPARVTSNPKNMFQLPKFSMEAGASALSAVNSLTKGSGDSLGKYGSVVGDPIYAKLQLIFPAYYSTHFFDDHWAFGIGFIFNAFTQSEASQTGNVDPSTIFNAGPAITIGRRLLEEDRLSVGLTMHTEFRGSINRNISITDFLSGENIRGNNLGGNGIGLDADVGSTFRPHWDWLGAEYQLGVAINNVLGGYYKNLGRPIKDWPGDPEPSYRSYNFGVSGTKKQVWIFDQLLAAFEVTDIGNNRNGSIFRTLHLGTEAKWASLAARLGVNQGYLAAGFGLSAGCFSLNLATYGEEMSLNSGGMEDRRYALDFGFQL